MKMIHSKLAASFSKWLSWSIALRKFQALAKRRGSGMQLLQRVFATWIRDSEVSVLHKMIQNHRTTKQHATGLVKMQRVTARSNHTLLDHAVYRVFSVLRVGWMCSKEAAHTQQWKVESIACKFKCLLLGTKLNTLSIEHFQTHEKMLLAHTQHYEIAVAQIARAFGIQNISAMALHCLARWFSHAEHQRLALLDEMRSNEMTVWEDSLYQYVSRTWSHKFAVQQLLRVERSVQHLASMQTLLTCLSQWHLKAARAYCSPNAITMTCGACGYLMDPKSPFSLSRISLLNSALEVPKVNDLSETLVRCEEKMPSKWWLY